jgi:hypothetical protein
VRRVKVIGIDGVKRKLIIDILKKMNSEINPGVKVVDDHLHLFVSDGYHLVKLNLGRVYPGDGWLEAGEDFEYYFYADSMMDLLSLSKLNYVTLHNKIMNVNGANLAHSECNPWINAALTRLKEGEVIDDAYSVGMHTLKLIIKLFDRGHQATFHQIGRRYVGIIEEHDLTFLYMGSWTGNNLMEGN